MPTSELIAVVAIVVVAALTVVVALQLAGLRRIRGRGATGVAQLPGSEMRRLEDGSWEVFLVRDGVHRQALADVRAREPDAVRMDVELRPARRGRSPSVVVVAGDAEVGRLHTAVAAALFPSLTDGPLKCSARVRTRTSKRSGEERVTLSVIVPADAVAVSGYAKG